jgi:mono/diheme cytochrome c family protein
MTNTHEANADHIRRRSRVVHATLLAAALGVGAACTDGGAALPDTSPPLSDDPTAPDAKPAKLPPKGPDLPGSAPRSSRAIDFGPTVSLDRPPPPLGGASVLVLDDGSSVVATDPDRDRVMLVDLTTHAVRTVPLLMGDEPGRLAQEGGRVHVVLDRGGAVATIDLETAQVVARRGVCAAPRGIALRGTDLLVACSGGELVKLPSDPAGEAPRVLSRIARDLRDVVVVGSDLLISRFRSAEVLRVRAEDGVVLARARSRARESFVGWRLVKHGDDSAALVHQQAVPEVVEDDNSSYGGADCSGPIRSVITSFTPSGNGLQLTHVTAASCDGALPLDFARSPTNNRWAVIAAGNARLAGRSQVRYENLEEGTQPFPSLYAGLQAVAVAVTPTDRLVVLSREPAVLRVSFPGVWSTDMEIPLGGESREDTGHAIFHTSSGGAIACASCHPGGGDDGRVWPFAKGNRRTQPLAGMLEGTAPYHWDGDMESVDAFGPAVFSGLMAGPALSANETHALSTYLRRLPGPRVSPASDEAVVQRGKALFERANVGCNNCHSGASLTNNAMASVGTGPAFQVPSLRDVAVRAPYLHDGRAATLLDSFTMPGHGNISGLGVAELQDLVTYVESL